MVEESPQVNPVEPGPEPETTSPWQTTGVFTEPSFAPPSAVETNASNGTEASGDTPERSGRRGDGRR